MNRNKKAFTLIESIVYIGLFGIIFITMAQFALTVSERNQDSEEKINVERSMLTAIQHISETFETVTTINEAQTVFNNNSGSLVLSNGTSTLTYNINQGLLNYNNGTANFTITQTGIAINKLLIEPIRSSKTNNLLGVRITVGLYSIKEPDATREITTSFIL